MSAGRWWRRWRRPVPAGVAASQPHAADELTGLASRAGLRELMAQALVEGRPGVVVLLDIDHFKLFNDRHGHSVGDIVLREIAQRLADHLAPPPRLARYGGDEFVAFLPGLSVAEGLRRAQACADALRAPFALPGGAEIVTFSGGIATLSGDAVDDVWRACDAALHAAKARGRDRVVAFDDDTRRMVAERRTLAATVSELQQRNRALREEARTDALTGLRNRLALDELLEQGPNDRRLQRTAVAFVDVDHFGNYNHIHGDGAGDDALRAVAQAIKTHARGADFVFRKGGEEFVLVLPATDHAAALAAGERLRKAVEALALPHSASATSTVVTVTVGIATAQPGHTLRQLLQAAAEQAMAAKVGGRRNQVHAVRLQG
jgi:diguanylate cyclase (GGDEF)-like protein